MDALPKAEKITLRRDKLTCVVGMAFDDAPTGDPSRLGLRRGDSRRLASLYLPSWRFDIAIKEDLIEEAGAIYGYNNIPNVPPVAHLSMNEQREADLKPLKRIRHLLVDRPTMRPLPIASLSSMRWRSLLFPQQDPIVLLPRSLRRHVWRCGSRCGLA